MNTCPHCGRRIYEPGAVMCEFCAEAISTDELFEMMTVGGWLPDFAIALIPWLIGGLAMLALALTLILKAG